MWGLGRNYLGPLSAEGDDKSGNRGRGRFKPDSDGLVQVDRMGNPAVNTALIPGPLKDAFNFAQPKDDPKDFASVIVNQILTLDKKFQTCDPNNCTNPNIPF